MSIWTAPTELPDLRRVSMVAIDTETNDEGLRADHGSGWPWHGGSACGISVAWREDSASGQLFPLRHPNSENSIPDRSPLAQGADRSRRALRHLER